MELIDLVKKEYEKEKNKSFNEKCRTVIDEKRDVEVVNGIKLEWKRFGAIVDLSDPMGAESLGWCIARNVEKYIINEIRDKMLVEQLTLNSVDAAARQLFSKKGNMLLVAPDLCDLAYVLINSKVDPAVGLENEKNPLYGKYKVVTSCELEPGTGAVYEYDDLVLFERPLTINEKGAVTFEFAIVSGLQASNQFQAF